jgi:hypothetical protein
MVKVQKSAVSLISTSSDLFYSIFFANSHSVSLLSTSFCFFLLLCTAFHSFSLLFTAFHCFPLLFTAFYCCLLLCTCCTSSRKISLRQRGGGGAKIFFARRKKGLRVTPSLPGSTSPRNPWVLTLGHIYDLRGAQRSKKKREAVKSSRKAVKSGRKR